MNVVISPNLKKTSQRIDINGNTLNRQGQITELAEKPYVPTPEELASAVNPKPAAPTPTVVVQTNPLSIQEQIDEAKANLKKLEELKKLKIQEMEAQLELLKQ